MKKYCIALFSVSSNLNCKSWKFLKLCQSSVFWKICGLPIIFLCPISKCFLYILVSSFKKGRRFAKSCGKWEALNDNDFTELCLLTPIWSLFKLWEVGSFKWKWFHWTVLAYANKVYLIVYATFIMLWPLIKRNPWVLDPNSASVDTMWHHLSSISFFLSITFGSLPAHASISSDMYIGILALMPVTANVKGATYQTLSVS